MGAEKRNKKNPTFKTPATKGRKKQSVEDKMRHIKNGHNNKK